MTEKTYIPSRYSKVSETRLPRKRKRTLAMTGFGDDLGKYFKCWNCGFICNKETDAIERGPYGTGGAITETFDNPDVVILLAEDGSYLLEETGDYIYSESQTLYKSLVTKGCKFCGSTNYR